MEKLTTIRNLIANHKLAKAFEFTIECAEKIDAELYQRAILLKSQYTNWSNNDSLNLGVKTEEKNKIINGLLSIVSDIEKEKGSKNELNSNDFIEKKKEFKENKSNRNVLFILISSILFFCFGILASKSFFKNEKNSKKEFDWNYDVRNVGRLFFQEQTLKYLEENLEKVSKKSKINEPFLKGRIYHQLGDWSKAKTEYEKAVKLYPNDMEAKLMFGRTLMNFFEHEKASKLFIEVLEQDSNNLIANYNYGVCLMHLFESSKNENFLLLSKKIFKKIIDYDRFHENLGAFQNYGQLCFLSKDYENSILALNNVIDKSPLFAKAHFYKALALYELEDKMESLNSLITSFELDNTLINKKGTYKHILHDSEVGKILTDYLKLSKVEGQ